jgi:dTDP-4-amino-4,6-dideoxygalactose transaminase
MDEIMDIAREFNLFVLEDVAQAFGGKWQDKKLGSIGVAGALSFFPSKNLGGFGDAGMVSTDGEEIAECVRMLLRHGGKDKYNVDHIGYNARLDTLQAAVLLAKLGYIDEFNEKRRSIADRYNEGLKDVDGLVVPSISGLPSSGKFHHVYHQYTLRVLNGKRDELQRHLKENGIATMVYYPVPLHKMKVFHGRCKVVNELPHSERAPGEVLSLPTEPLMGEEDVAAVIHTIRAFFKRSSG